MISELKIVFKTLELGSDSLFLSEKTKTANTIISTGIENWTCFI